MPALRLFIPCMGHTTPTREDVVFVFPWIVRSSNKLAMLYLQFSCTQGLSNRFSYQSGSLFA